MTDRPADIRAVITNIQRLSLDDGPGIRSTVFFKGCPLACKWCHNPECISGSPQLQFNEEKCVGCGGCESVCGQKACTVIVGKRQYDKSKCVVCGACADACPYAAIDLIGRPYAVDELLTQLMKDKPFYDESGGGVTFSGGEPLVQGRFLKEALCRLKELGVHTAVDTSGAVGWEEFLRVLNFTDLFLYDIKAWRSERHREFTGAPNELILRNLKKLSETGKAVVIRMPLIAGANDGIEDAAAVSRFIAGLPSVELVELLPFHAYGFGKYKAVGVHNDGAGFSPPKEEHLNAIKKIISGSGVPVRIKKV